MNIHCAEVERLQKKIDELENMMHLFQYFISDDTMEYETKVYNISENIRDYFNPKRSLYHLFEKLNKSNNVSECETKF